MFKRKIKLCKHKFQDKGYFVLYGKYPRVYAVCSRCGVAIHRPIYTRQQLDDFEQEQLREEENGY